MKAINRVTILVLLLGSTAISAPTADTSSAPPAQQLDGEQQLRTGVRFGINSYLGNIRHSDVRGHVAKPTAEDRTHYLDAVRDLGVTTMRETFMNWAEIEPEQGKGYQFDAFDDIARKASERGIEILALAYPYPTWATGKEPTPPDQLVTSMIALPQRRFEADFRRFVRAVVARYCGQGPESLPLKHPIRHWIFGNEFDIPDYKLSPDEYAFWLKAFYEEVKAADPGAQVVPMGYCNPWYPNFLDRFLSSKNLQGPAYPYFDVFTYHAYPYNDFGDTLWTSLNGCGDLSSMDVAGNRIRTCLEDHGVKVNLWLEETGASRVDGSEQADLAIKTVVHAASTGVRRVNFHGLWDLMLSPANHDNDCWGVLENTPSGQVPVRKPSFTAYQTMLRLIGRNEGVRCLAPGRYHASLPGGKSVYILWSEPAKEGKPEFLKGNIRVTTLQNQQETMDATGFVLTKNPVFIEPVE
jgi:hypothetical protein